MKEYTYAGGAWVAARVNQVVGALALLGSCAVAIGLPVYAMGSDAPADASMATLGCLSLGILFGGGQVGAALMNSYPTVWVADDHLAVQSFLFARAKVPWGDVVDVGAGRVPWGFVLVRTRGLTPLHRVYGWLYSRTLMPSFLIGPQIQERDELIREIKWRARAADASLPDRNLHG